MNKNIESSQDLCPDGAWVPVEGRGDRQQTSKHVSEMHSNSSNNINTIKDIKQADVIERYVGRERAEGRLFTWSH